jgi:hypothetical protein
MVGGSTFVTSLFDPTGVVARDLNDGESDCGCHLDTNRPAYDGISGYAGNAAVVTPPVSKHSGKLSSNSHPCLRMA